MVFSRRVTFALLHLQTVWPNLEFSQTQLCLRRWYSKHSPTLKFAHEGERGKNKTWGKLSCIRNHKLTFMCYDIQNDTVASDECLFLFMWTSREYFTPVKTSIIINSEHSITTLFVHAWFQEPLNNVHLNFLLKK